MAMMNSTPATNISEKPTTDPVLLSPELLLLLIIADITFGFIITLGNATLFFTIYRDPCRCLRTPSVFLIANLSVADFFMGIVSYLRAVELIYQYCGLPDLTIVNITGYFMGAVSILAAVSTLMAMSYDRFIAIIKPFQYPQKVTISKAKISIAVIWINALVMSVLPVSDVKQENFLLAYCYSHFLVPSFILTTAYLKIYKKIVLQRNELQEVRASLTAINRKKQLERDNRMVIAFVLILLVFYCSFLPYFIFVHILYFCPCRTSHAFGLYRYVANEFLSVSSMVDPFMYAWRLPRFNRSFRSCFQRLRKRNAVAELNGTSSNINLAAVGRDRGKLTVAHSENSSKTNPKTCIDVGTKDSTLKTS